MQRHQVVERIAGLIVEMGWIYYSLFAYKHWPICCTSAAHPIKIFEENLQ